MRGERKRILGEAGLFTLIGAAAILWAATDDHPTKSIAILAAIFTLLAFTTGWVVVRTQWPQFEEWRKATRAKPQLRVWLEHARDQSTVPAPVESALIPLAHDSVILRVVVANDGDAVLRSAMVNIVVPDTVVITPIDPESKTHYPSPLPSRSDRIVPGQVTTVHFTVIRDEFTRGHHAFHAVLSPTGPAESWPVMVEVDGDPTPPEDVRFTWASIERPSNG